MPAIPPTTSSGRPAAIGLTNSGGASAAYTMTYEVLDASLPRPGLQATLAVFLQRFLYHGGGLERARCRIGFGNLHNSLRPGHRIG